MTCSCRRPLTRSSSPPSSSPLVGCSTPTWTGDAVVGAFWGPMLFELPVPERTLQQNRFKSRYPGYTSKVGETAHLWGIHESYERDNTTHLVKFSSCRVGIRCLLGAALLVSRRAVHSSSFGACKSRFKSSQT